MSASVILSSYGGFNKRMKISRYLFLSLPLLLTLAGTPGSAALFELTYTGALSTEDALNPAGAALDTFDAETAFSVRALFDTASPNLVAPLPLPGFVAYSPQSIQMTIGGTTYSVDTHDSNPGTGVGVIIFDRNTVFFPGYYGIGLIQDPLADGAGFVGDFVGASPDFTVDALTATTFNGYRGAGFSNAVPNSPTSTPWRLRNNAGDELDLTFTFRIEELAEGAALHTAELNQVPEPSTMGIAACGLLAMAAVARRRTLRR